MQFENSGNQEEIVQEPDVQFERGKLVSQISIQAGVELNGRHTQEERI